jgi:hypothetical protein
MNTISAEGYIVLDTAYLLGLDSVYAATPKYATRILTTPGAIQDNTQCTAVMGISRASSLGSWST